MFLLIYLGLLKGGRSLRAVIRCRFLIRVAQRLLLYNFFDGPLLVSVGLGVSVSVSQSSSVSVGYGGSVSGGGRHQSSRGRRSSLAARRFFGLVRVGLGLGRSFGRRGLGRFLAALSVVASHLSQSDRQVRFQLFSFIGLQAQGIN